MKNEIFISSDNIKFLFSCTDNEKDIYLGINLNDGKPLVTSPDKRSKEYVYNAQIITYPQLLGYLDPIYFPIFDSIHHKCYNRDNIEEFEIFKKKYSNLNDVNWEE